MKSIDYISAIIVKNELPNIRETNAGVADLVGT